MVHTHRNAEPLKTRTGGIQQVSALHQNWIKNSGFRSVVLLALPHMYQHGVNSEHAFEKER
jgi:hypothetical protein